MTVGELEETLSNDEFIHWTVYYARKRQHEQLEALKSKRRG